MAETVMVFLASFLLALVSGTATTEKFDCGESWGMWWIRHHCNTTCGQVRNPPQYGVLCERNRTQHGKRVSVTSGQCESGVCEESVQQSQIFYKLVNESRETTHNPIDDKNVMKMYILRNGSSVAHPCRIDHAVRVNGTRCINKLQRQGDENVNVIFGYCLNGTCEALDDGSSSVESKALFDGLDDLYTDNAPAC